MRCIFRVSNQRQPAHCNFFDFLIFLRHLRPRARYAHLFHSFVILYTLGPRPGDRQYQYGIHLAFKLFPMGISDLPLNRI